MYKLKYVIIGAIIAELFTPTMYVFASVSKELTQEERESGFYDEKGQPIYEGRPAVNPDFDPDEDCNIAYELKCIPGSQQDCPEGFHNGEDDVCSPVGCQEGYHGVDEDETGLCYPNDEGCGDHGPYVLIEGERGDHCALLYYICDEAEHRGEDYCIEYCKENPDRLSCVLKDMNVSVSINSDGDTNNDIPPDGEGLFCDHPSDPGGCYDRNDNPESFCVNYQQYTDFCEIIGEICDDGKSSNDIDSTDPECTDQDEDCPKNYVRYDEYCAQYRADCDIVGEYNVSCNGKQRTDGLLRCDEPSHPGYKFCN